MRSLSSTLLNEQKSSFIDALVKVYLSSGNSTYTYYRNRVLDLNHLEEALNQKATIILDNHDGALTDLDFKGYTCTISYGIRTTSGDEYSATAPLVVIYQEFQSLMGKLSCVLTCRGVFELLAESRASSNYILPDGGKVSLCNNKTAKNAGVTTLDLEDIIPRIITGSTILEIAGDATDYTVVSDVAVVNGEATVTITPALQFAVATAVVTLTYPANLDTKTVKTCINEILGVSSTTLGNCFTGETGYVVTWDSEDDLVDVYTPKSNLRIYRGDSRLAVVRRLLAYTKCVIRSEADGLHILVPTISGSTYDYTYSLASGYHKFLSKATRNQLVIPNYIEYKSNSKDATQCSGTATDTASYALRPVREYKNTYLLDDAQGVLLAAALLARYQMYAQIGAASVPMNVGQEVYDYISVKDKRQGDTITGNIGSLTRNWNGEKREWTMSFSFGGWESHRQAFNDMDTYSSDSPADTELGSSSKKIPGAYIENLTADNIRVNGGIYLLATNTIDDTKDGTTFSRVLSTSITAGKIKLDEIVDGTTYKLVSSTEITSSKIKIEALLGLDIGTNDGSGLIDNGAGYAQGATTVHVDALGNAKTVLKGVLLTIAGNTGTYLITAEATTSADAEGECDLIISPGLNAAVLDNAVVTISAYGLTRSTQISAGYINLTADTLKTGKWYDQSGVIIDASHGIILSGIDMSFVTIAGGVAITAFADGTGGTVLVTAAGHGMVAGDRVNIQGTTSYDGNFAITYVSASQFKITKTWVANDATGIASEIQTYVGSDGVINAGAGAIKLDSSGLKVYDSNAKNIVTLGSGGLVIDTPSGAAWTNGIIFYYQGANPAYLFSSSAYFVVDLLSMVAPAVFDIRGGLRAIHDSAGLQIDLNPATGKLHLKSDPGSNAGVILQDRISSFVEIRPRGDASVGPAGTKYDSNPLNFSEVLYNSLLSEGSANHEIQAELNLEMDADYFTLNAETQVVVHESWLRHSLVDLFHSPAIIYARGNPIRIVTVYDDITGNATHNLALVAYSEGTPGGAITEPIETNGFVVVEYPGLIGFRPPSLASDREFYNVVVQGESYARFNQNMWSTGEVTFKIGDGSGAPAQFLKVNTNGNMEYKGTCVHSTPTRVVGTVYQNTDDNIRVITIGVKIDTGLGWEGLYYYMGSSSLPSFIGTGAGNFMQVISDVTTPVTITCFTFLVPAGYYYKVVWINHTETIAHWSEYDLY